MRLLTLSITACLITACATTGPMEYGPSADGRFGYEDMRIEDDRYRVTYRGSGGMPIDVVEDFALRRMAEIAVDNGYDWFRVIGSDFNRERRGGVGIGMGVGSGHYGRRSGVGVGVSGDLGEVGGQDFITARMEALMGQGDQPEGDNVYDAVSVLNARAGEGAISE